MDENIIFALDENLGFNTDDPVWSSFFQRFNITLLFYTDMKQLTEKMKENTVHFAYLPTANLFYFRSDPFYTPLANALFCSNNESESTCVLVVSKESGLTSSIRKKDARLYTPLLYIELLCSRTTIMEKSVFHSSFFFSFERDRALAATNRRRYFERSGCYYGFRKCLAG